MVFPQARLAWVADNDKAASVLLAARYPGVPNLGDIKAVDWNTVERVDLLAAGIPCQPHSYAGKGRGKDDDRDLVEAFIEAVRGLRPGIVILENVPGFKRGGLPRVLGALASMGFDARWHSVRASEAGASHRRERVFVLAVDPNSESWKQWRLSASGEEETGGARPNPGGSSGMGSEGCVTLLPTPLANTNGPSSREIAAGNPKNRLETAIALLPTPTATSGHKDGRGGLYLSGAAIRIGASTSPP